MHNKEYIRMQQKGLENIDIAKDTEMLKEYQSNMFVKDTGKFISNYQKRNI